MIKDNFKRGDRLPNTEYYNAVARAANMVSGYKSSVFNTSEANRNMLMGQVVIDVINKTALPLPSFSVLEIDNPRWRDGQDILSDVRSLGILYAGEMPSGDEGKTAVITLDTLAPDEINRAVIMGIVPCKVNVLDIAHRFASPVEDDTTKLQSSESGNIRLVLQPTQTGEQVLDVMLGFGGGASVAPTPTEDSCMLITPVCNGFNASIIATDSIDTESGFNALRAGLGKLQSGGTGSPLQVFMIDSDRGTLVLKTSGSDPLYYKALTVKTHSGALTPEYDVLGTIEYNELSGYQDFAGHAVLYAFLQSLRFGENAVTDVQYDYSGIWETTTDASEAIPNNYVLVSPHHVTGYYPYRSTFKVGGSESADISVEGRDATTTAYALDYELNTTVRMTGQWNGTIKYAEVTAGNITWTTINDVGDYINHYMNVKIVCPTYNGTNIDIYDVNKIENTCVTGVAVPMGMYIDSNNMPQFVNCESIPFQCMIPLLSVQCFYRLNGNTCSPAYQTNSFPITLEGNKITLLTASYLPGTTCN